ncbi:MAG: flagellar motor switch protein FliN [Oscillospiraceae bacterium]
MSENQLLTADELDTIGEIMNISMGAAATAVSTMLERQVMITTPSIEQNQFKNIDCSELEPAIVVKINYVQGLKGTNAIILRRNDMRIIIELLMGNDYAESEEDFEFDEMSMSAACEVMNQMMGASSTALSELLGKPINISTPVAELVETATEAQQSFGNIEDEADVVAISFKMTIKETLDTTFTCLMPLDLTKEIVLSLSDGEEEEEPEPELPQTPPPPTPTPPPIPTPQPIQSPPPMQEQPQPTMQDVPPTPTPPPVQPIPAQPIPAQPTPVQPAPMQTAPPMQAQQPTPQQPIQAQPVVQTPPPMQMPQPQYAPPVNPMPYQQPYSQGADSGFQQPYPPQMPYQQPYMQQPQYGAPPQQQYAPPYNPYQEPQQNVRYIAPPVNVKQADFPEFAGKNPANYPPYSSNMNMLMGVQLEVSVVVGRTKQKIKDVLDFGQGSVIELDKQTGSPAEIVVNGQLLALGDVVVVGDNFGVRITEIVGTKELLDSLETKK